MFSGEAREKEQQQVEQLTDDMSRARAVHAEEIERPEPAGVGAWYMTK